MDMQEVKRVEFTMTHVEVSLEECDLNARQPHWVQRFVKAIDNHRNGANPYATKHRKSRIFSGNLAKNILKVVLASLPQAVE